MQKLLDQLIVKQYWLGKFGVGTDDGAWSRMFSEVQMIFFLFR